MPSRKVKEYKHPPCEGCSQIRKWDSNWRLSRCLDCKRPARYKTHFIAAKLQEEILDLRQEIKEIAFKCNQMVLYQLSEKLKHITQYPSSLPTAPSDDDVHADEGSGSLVGTTKSLSLDSLQKERVIPRSGIVTLR